MHTCGKRGSSGATPERRRDLRDVEEVADVVVVEEVDVVVDVVEVFVHVRSRSRAVVEVVEAEPEG